MAAGSCWCCWAPAKYFHTHENDFSLPPASSHNNSGNKWPGSRRRCMPHTANKQQLFLPQLLLPPATKKATRNYPMATSSSNISIATCLTSRRDQSERIKHKKAQSHKKLQVEKVIICDNQVVDIPVAHLKQI